MVVSLRSEYLWWDSALLGDLGGAAGYVVSWKDGFWGDESGAVRARRWF